MLLISLALALAAQNGAPSAPTIDDVILSSQEGDYLLGWTVEPPAPIPGEEKELDRLSRSPSGSGFLPQLFGSQGDDSRVPVMVTLRALDKVTAQFRDLEVPIGEPAQFGPLTLLPRTCYSRPPEEFPETTVFLEVYADASDEAGQRATDGLALEEAARIKAAGGTEADLERVSIRETIDTAMFGRALFRGWMFASSPSVNAMQHPTYDVWVINCTMEDPDI
ncbi:MAG: DUF2155 domain-containing protein [Parvularcula sp.]|jgi:hypothetical protein|nr:DUF2155 domain-containing protein [Parvularcula sp.]